MSERVTTINIYIFVIVARRTNIYRKNFMFGLLLLIIIISFSYFLFFIIIRSFTHWIFYFSWNNYYRKLMIKKAIDILVFSLFRSLSSSSSFTSYYYYICSNDYYFGRTQKNTHLERERKKIMKWTVPCLPQKNVFNMRIQIYESVCVCARIRVLKQ